MGLDVDTDYSTGRRTSRCAGSPRAATPRRRSTPATGGFGKNDGDNEITGVHVSDGDPGADGILGAKTPKLGAAPKWRWFYTQQHGDNVTYEVLVGSHGEHGDHDDDEQ